MNIKKINKKLKKYKQIKKNIYKLTIQVGDESLDAHRNILALHSEVFRSCFMQESMLEAKDGVIEIADTFVEPVSFTMFLYIENLKKISFFIIYNKLSCTTFYLVTEHFALCARFSLS